MPLHNCPVVKSKKPQKGFLTLIALALLIHVGCGKEPKIEKRTVPPLAKITPAIPETGNTEKGIPVPKVSEKEVRMLAAILPLKDSAISFKMEGDDKAVQKQYEKFQTLLTSVHYDSEGLNWELPKGWKNLPASKMRLATIVLPEQNGESLSISVMEVSLPSGPKQTTLANINRWLGQLQLPHITTEVIENKTSEEGGATQLKSEAGEISVINIFGKKKGGMRPPFAPFAR